MLFFLGGLENWRYFFRLRKASATGALFHPRLKCNFQKLLRCHREENFQHGYTGGVHVKIQMGMLVQFFGLEIWANPVFSGGVENWRYFLGYVKLRPQEHIFTPDCNVIFRNYCVAIARKICNTATPVHGAMAKFADI